MDKAGNEMSLAARRQEMARPTPARERLSVLFDEGSFTELDAFVDGGVVTGYGYIEGVLAYAFSQDVLVKSGAVGRAHAAKVKKVYELAETNGAPVIGIFDSNGADMAQGGDALAAYGQMLRCANRLSGVVPQISVIAGVCGATAALIAAAADFVVMSKDAQFFLTPPFVAQADGAVEGAGSAENAAKAGVASFLCDDAIQASIKAREIVRMLPQNNLSPVPVFEFEDVPQEIDALSADALVRSVADAGSVTEAGEGFGDCAYTALGTLSGSTVGFISTARAKGCLSSDDMVKIARFVRTCDAFGIPVVTFVDSEGFAGSAQDELCGEIRQASKLAHAYAEATCPKISVVTGQACGGVFVALAGTNANADLTLAWDGAVISPMPPDGAVEFMWHDRLKGCEDLSKARQALVDEYKATEASAVKAASAGCVDSVIEPQETRAALVQAVLMLENKRSSRLPKKHSNNLM